MYIQHRVGLVSRYLQPWPPLLRWTRPFRLSFHTALRHHASSRAREQPNTTRNGSSSSERASSSTKPATTASAVATTKSIKTKLLTKHARTADIIVNDLAATLEAHRASNRAKIIRKIPRPPPQYKDWKRLNLTDFYHDKHKDGRDSGSSSNSSGRSSEEAGHTNRKPDKKKSVAQGSTVAVKVKVKREVGLEGASYSTTIDAAAPGPVDVASNKIKLAGPRLTPITKSQKWPDAVKEIRSAKRMQPRREEEKDAPIQKTKTEMISGDLRTEQEGGLSDGKEKAAFYSSSFARGKK